MNTVQWPEISLRPANMSDIGRSVAMDLRFHYIDLKNKVRRIDLMCAVNRTKNPGKVIELNSDRALVMLELRTLIKDYRKAWKLAMRA